MQVREDSAIQNEFFRAYIWCSLSSKEKRAASGKKSIKTWGQDKERGII